MIAATPTGIAEGEELLVGHLRRHGLAVEPPALAEEEVAGVDDLLHLAERLGVGLADLARDEPGERLLVLLDEAADLGDHAAADRRGHGGPLALGAARAARQASTKCVGVARAATSATTSARLAGLVDSIRCPSLRSSPPTIDPTVLVSVMLIVVAYSRRE